MHEMHDILKSIGYAAGRSDALDLRSRASEMNGTEIIAEESKIPDWDPKKNYTNCPVGTPVKDGGQVYTLLQPYNAAEHPQHPAEIRAHWSLCHTKDPARAKPWMDPQGTSGMYTMGECYRDVDGVVHRCKVKITNFSAKDYPEHWETVV